MKKLKKPLPPALVFIPALLALTTLTAVGIWKVNKQWPNPNEDPESKAFVASLKEGIASEMAKSPEASPPAPIPEKAHVVEKNVPLMPLPSRALAASVEVKPEYPRIAKIVRAQGPVDVLLHVDGKGVPVSGEVLNGNSLFREEALKASLGWRFQPALDRGKPIASDFRIHFNFKMA